MSYKLSLILCMMLMPELCVAQIENGNLIEEVLEYIAESRPEDQDYSEITERLNFYQKYPLDINKVSVAELQELVFLSSLQIDKFIAHREESGLIQDLLELQSIDGFTIETVRWLKHFLVLNAPEMLSGISLNKLYKHGEHDLIIRMGKVLEQQSGFVATDSTKADYFGSADRMFTRYRFNYGSKVSLSCNMEKDAGETFLGNGGKGFDFYSGNVSFKGSRLVTKMVVGDYSLQFGQGLTLWSGLGFGKGAGLTTIAKYGGGLRPYSSVNESSFFRGVAATLIFNRILLTPFVSYRKMDATLSDDKETINSISVSGLHRTQSELNNKNIITQQAYGANAEYKRSGHVFGITGYKIALSKPVSASTTLYNKYDFTGSSLTNLGLYYSYTYRNTYFFGEAAHSISSGTAFLNGLLTSLSSKVSASLLYRNYSRNYHSFFNNGLSESTEASNERGLYAGLNFKFDSKIELTAYFDVFTFPWLKFRVDAPSQGHEMLAQLTYNLNKKLKITTRFKLQQKQENATLMSNGSGLEDVEKQNFRVELAYKLNSSLSFRNRVEIASYKKGYATKEFGFLTYQDILYKPLSSKLSGNVRFAIFDTGSFNSRIYAYENDVLYSYSVPAYQDKGIRFYVNGRYTLSRGVDLWVRYSQTSYYDRTGIGSGYDKIDGNGKSDVRIQLRFQF